MSEPSCIDLRPWAIARRYRWRWEEGYQVGDDAPWFVEIPCRYGLIYPKGGDILLAYCNRGIKRHVAKLDGLEHHQSDDDAEVFRFPVDLLDKVAAILKPRRRRTLDPDKARAIGRATAYGAQSTENAQKLTQGAG